MGDLRRPDARVAFAEPSTARLIRREGYDGSQVEGRTLLEAMEP